MLKPLVPKFRSDPLKGYRRKTGHREAETDSRHIQILIHPQHWTGSSQMNPYHTLGSAVQDRLEQINAEEFYPYLPSFPSKLLTVRAKFSYPFVPVQKSWDDAIGLRKIGAPFSFLLYAAGFVEFCCLVTWKNTGFFIVERLIRIVPCSKLSCGPKWQKSLGCEANICGCPENNCWCPYGHCGCPAPTKV